MAAAVGLRGRMAVLGLTPRLLVLQSAPLSYLEPCSTRPLVQPRMVVLVVVTTCLHPVQLVDLALVQADRQEPTARWAGLLSGVLVDLLGVELPALVLAVQVLLTET